MTSEATPLESYPELALYRHELEEWLSSDIGNEHRLIEAGHALCVLARDHAYTPERLLVAVRAGAYHWRASESIIEAQRRSQLRAARATHALNLLLDCYFS